jgi:translation elongation factor P/translation initiation factor 5A
MNPDDVQVRSADIHIDVVIVDISNAVKVVDIANVPRGHRGAKVRSEATILTEDSVNKGVKVSAEVVCQVNLFALLCEANFGVSQLIVLLEVLHD